MMNHPTNANDSSNASPPPEAIGEFIKPWFAFAVVGLFVFACFYTLKVAVDLFLPIVLAGFLGFLLTPVTRWLKKIGLSPFWAPLIGTLGFLAILLCLFGALWLSLARFEPDFPQYLDHIQQRLAPSIDAVQKSSVSIDRLSNWLNPWEQPSGKYSGPKHCRVRSWERAEVFSDSDCCACARFLSPALWSTPSQETRRYDSGGVGQTKRRRDRGRD